MDEKSFQKNEKFCLRMQLQTMVLDLTNLLIYKYCELIAGYSFSFY